MSMKMLLRITILPQPKCRSFSKSKNPPESKVIPVLEEFDLGKLDYKSYKNKIANICNYFPQLEGNKKLKRTISDTDVLLKPNQKYFFLKFTVAIAEPVFPMFCMKKAWLMGIRVENNFLSFESKEDFKPLVPLLKLSGIEEVDIAYRTVILDPGNVLYLTYLELQNAITHLSKGFDTSKQGYYAYNASMILAFSVTSAVIPGMFREMRKLFLNGKTGTAHVPKSVKSTLLKWADISELAINGGKCQLFSDDIVNDMVNKSGVSKMVSIVMAMKFNKKNPMPKIKASPYNGPRNTGQPSNGSKGFSTLVAYDRGRADGSLLGFPLSRAPCGDGFSMFGGCMKITSGTVRRWLPRIGKLLK